MLSIAIDGFWWPGYSFHDRAIYCYRLLSMAINGWGIVFMTVLSIDYLCYLCAIYVLSMCYLCAFYVLSMCYLYAFYTSFAEYL